MSTETLQWSSRGTRTAMVLLQLAATTALFSACGGGQLSSHDRATQAAATPIYSARFTDDTVSGLRFRISGVGEGTTSDVGGFQFAEGRPVDFMVGDAVDRVTIGSAILDYKANSIVSFNLQHLEEVRAPNGDVYLANLVRLLALLDSNDDSSDGFQIDAAANSAIGEVVDGTRSLDFAASADLFARDTTIAGVAAALNRRVISSDEALVRYQMLFRR